MKRMIFTALFLFSSLSYGQTEHVGKDSLDEVALNYMEYLDILPDSQDHPEVPFSQNSFRELDQSDILSYESDIVSKFGGKYETEISVVARHNGQVRFKELIGKAGSGQKNIEGSEKKQATLSYKFTVKNFKQAIADLIEKLGDKKGRYEIGLMFSRRYSMTEDGSDFRDYPVFVSLNLVSRVVREKARTYPNSPVWTMAGYAQKLEDIEPRKAALMVRYKLVVLRMNY